MARLAAITGRPMLPLSAEHGLEGPRTVAFIDEAWCIGCTLCLKACPTDAIVGANKTMHTVMEPYCTGCELCIPVCPVDCIQLGNASGTATGWAAWSQPLAQQARERYQRHRDRMPLDTPSDPLHGESHSPGNAEAAETPAATPQAAGEPSARQAAIAAAMERARQRRALPSR